MTHTGEKPYVCPFCQHGFIQRAPFKRHVLHMHGVEVPKGNVRLFIEEHSNKGSSGVGDEIDDPERPRKRMRKRVHKS